MTSVPFDDADVELSVKLMNPLAGSVTPLE